MVARRAQAAELHGSFSIHATHKEGIMRGEGEGREGGERERRERTHVLEHLAERAASAIAVSEYEERAGVALEVLVVG